MVKALLLGLFAVMMCGLACAAPAHPITRPSHPEASPSPPHSLLEDPATRSERSTNLSHIQGTARKIQMYMSKNRHLQLLPDGTVNGTTDDESAYTILQRTTVGIGQLKIQGVATCQYLCMDSCGLLYGSREFGDECIFSETIENNHYNTYSSTKYSNKNRTMYLAMNRRGQPRKVLIKAGNSLGHHATFTRVLTRTVSQERADRLHPMRHHAHMCVSSPHDSAEPQSTVEPSGDHPRCRKRKKKKKKKRKCGEGESESDVSQKRQVLTNPRKKLQNKLNRKCESEDSEECQRIEVTNKKKRKNNKFGDKPSVSTAMKKKKKLMNPKVLKHNNKKTRVSVTTEVPTTSRYFPVTDDFLEEDYLVDATTDWDESTVSPEDGTFRPD